MAAAIKALNARIRSNPTTDYLCSTRTFLSQAALHDGGRGCCRVLHYGLHGGYMCLVDDA